MSVIFYSISYGKKIVKHWSLVIFEEMGHCHDLHFAALRLLGRDQLVPFKIFFIYQTSQSSAKESYIKNCHFRLFLC